MNALRRLETDLNKLIVAAFRANVGRDETHRRIQSLLRERGFVGAGKNNPMVQDLILTARKSYDWLSTRSINAAEAGEVRSILLGPAQGFATIGGKIEEGVLEVVDRGFRENLSTEEITNLLRPEVGNREAVARSIARSTQLAFSRANTFRVAAESGIETFRLVGRSPERQWCKDHYERVYTIEQIEKMDNGITGWHPKYHCGGPNCVHRWDAEIE